ncbi:hypothetical protein TrST_g11416 [Triparma strigata]|uniref:Peptidase S54 rhomboid domain-containing protein n=1 Tax=Triparma strigata TaxID=1606541 RepID=A0A9W7AYR6_9STRA|nr:hypothetical protein TrST_g11416 [Triparma strigata]
MINTSNGNQPSNGNPLDAVIELLTSADGSLSRTETYECSTVSASTSKPRKKKKRAKSNKNWTDLKQHPTTFLIIFVNVAAFAYIKLYGVSPEVVTSSYDKIMSEKDFKSVVTSTYSHMEIWHIGLNLLSFLNFRAFMESRGSNSPVGYFKLIFALTFLSSAVSLVTIEMLTRFNLTNGRNVKSQQSLGFSGVLFSIITIITTQVPEFTPFDFVPFMTFKTYDLGIFKFNGAVFFELIVIQFVVKRASFIGHLGGIGAGFIVANGLGRYAEGVGLKAYFMVVFMFRLINLRGRNSVVDVDVNVLERVFYAQGAVLLLTVSLCFSFGWDVQNVAVETFLTVMVSSKCFEYLKTFVYTMNAIIVLDVIKLGMYLGVMGGSDFYWTLVLVSRIVVGVVSLGVVSRVLAAAGVEDFVVETVVKGLDTRNRVTLMGYDVLPVRESEIEVFGGVGRTLNSGREVETI